MQADEVARRELHQSSACDAANRSTVIDVKHLPAEMLSTSPTSLTRIDALECDEIVRCLAGHGMSVTRTADTLGISRATTYRRISRYGISLPRS